jgi:hypothetical protein
MSEASRLVRVWLPIAALLALSTSAQAQDTKPFTNEQLDQMTAQIALYPDSLLSQVLMAATYPDEFAAAAAWSKAHPDAKGDDAVTMVESEPWDPSVASLVAFPEVLITLGDQPDYVKNLGDAFLAQPEAVMDSVQRLRLQAQKAGNLKSNDQIKVATQPAETAPASAPARAPAAAPSPAPQTVVVQQPAPPPVVVQQPAPAPQVIVIEPAQPSVVYVPAYNPAVVYGPWAYPAYPPYYYPPPPGYWFSRTIATGIAWGIGIGVSNALWGGFHWGRGDVNINVNRYNNINVNKRIDVNSNRVTWNHNPDHRGKAAYRGGDATRKSLDKKFQAGGREQYRGKDVGRDGGRDASRERAAKSMQDRGIADKPGAGDRAKEASRDGARDKAQAADRDAARQRAQSGDRDVARQRAQAASQDNALRGVNSTQARAQADRGASSKAAVQRTGGDGDGGRKGGSDGGGRRDGGGKGGRAGGGGGARKS